MSNNELIGRQRAELCNVLAAIVAGSITLTEGCRTIVRLRFSLRQEENQLFLPFVGVESETDVFPLGDVRDLWAPESLKQMDAKRAKVEAHYRQWILEAAGNLGRFVSEHLRIEIGKVGKIVAGADAGRFVKVIDDESSTGGCLILTADDPEFRTGFDSWCEKERLENYFDQSRWEVEWQE